ncbi:MAG: sigma-70 family RNA polymerase sigma factor [Chloroflexi bacterium]|nr:sigma-70 family RNA polymerase sigma factor [Chloroflexota bacterium]
MRRSSLQETDEGQLIALAAEGDREAFGQLYEKYVFKVFRHIYYLANDVQVAEDLTAQTFLNALEAIHRYEMRGVPFLAWLLRIAYNLTMNHKKLQKNNGTAQLPETVHAEGSFYSPEETCEAKVNGERIWEGVRHLRGDQRQVIVMRFVDGLSYPDIAQVLGKSVGAVRVIQYRALSALRRMLEGEDLGYYSKSRAS